MSQIHTKHINTLCGQKVEFLNVKLAVHTVTTGLYSTKTRIDNCMKHLKPTPVRTAKDPAVSATVDCNLEPHTGVAPSRPVQSVQSVQSVRTSAGEHKACVCFSL